MEISDEDIERVARVLWENSLLKPYHATDLRPSSFPPEPEPDWQRFVPLAEKIIDAVFPIVAPGQSHDERHKSPPN